MRIDAPLNFRDARAFDGWSVDSSGLWLTLWWNEGNGKAQLFTSEDEESVRVLGFDDGPRPRPGWVGEGDHSVSVMARLAAPLGERRVVDATTGRKLSKRGIKQSDSTNNGLGIFPLW